MLSALELRGIRDVERGMQFLTNGRHFTFQRLAFLSNSVDCSRKFVKTRTGLEFAGLDIEGDHCRHSRLVSGGSPLIKSMKIIIKKKSELVLTLRSRPLADRSAN